MSWDGLTNYSWSACGFLWLDECMNSATIQLNYYYTQNYSVGTNEGVAAHEFGHAMGLDHTSGCVLMTPSTSTRNSCGIVSPQSDDINGINSLY